MLQFGSSGCSESQADAAPRRSIFRFLWKCPDASTWRSYRQLKMSWRTFFTNCPLGELQLQPGAIWYPFVSVFRSMLRVTGRFCTEGPKLEFGGPMSQADSGREVEGEWPGIEKAKHHWEIGTRDKMRVDSNWFYDLWKSASSWWQPTIVKSFAFLVDVCQALAAVFLCGSLRGGCRVLSPKPQRFWWTGWIDWLVSHRCKYLIVEPFLFQSHQSPCLAKENTRS